MKEQVKEMFAQITMPEKTERKIRAAMEGKESTVSHRRSGWKQAASLAALVVLIIALSPAARAAVSGWVVKYFWPGSDITIYEVNDGEVEATVAVVDTEAPGFARMVNGRLYFVGNGEKIDITDQITEEKPYYYSYVDDYGMTHEMAVGYSGSLENFGIYEFIWKEEDGEPVWKVGTGRNFLNGETNACYPWVETVWQDLGIPWQMPD
ncbi:MAG: hypothetical protein IKJ84_02235 [Oscillospiraceae bacterium]|nr:hypothetical protein [Oscillospiraceae bacterium]